MKATIKKGGSISLDGEVTHSFTEGQDVDMSTDNIAALTKAGFIEAKATKPAPSKAPKAKTGKA